MVPQVATTPQLVALDRVSKRYRRSDRWVLRDVDLAVLAGSTIAVRGPNGSGKSTLLRLLAGVTAPSRGSRRAGRRLCVGYAPDRLEPAPPFGTAAYLRHHGRLRGIPAPACAAQVAELAGRLGFDAVMGDPLGDLSKGTLQKVVLAQALLGRPELVVLDEPFSGLDADAKAALAELLGVRAAGGAGVLFSDHREGGEDLPVDRVWRLAGDDPGVHVDVEPAPDAGAPAGSHARRRIVAARETSDRVLTGLLDAGWHVERVAPAQDPAEVEIVVSRRRA